MFIRVVEYNGGLVIEADFGVVNDDWTPKGAGLIGCMVANASKHVGISDEALVILSRIKPSIDDIGDIMAWDDNFGWLGGIKYYCKYPCDLEGQRGFTLGKYNKIENTPSKGFLDYIKRSETITPES